MNQTYLISYRVFDNDKNEIHFGKAQVKESSEGRAVSAVRENSIQRFENFSRIVFYTIDTDLTNQEKFNEIIQGELV